MSTPMLLASVCPICQTLGQPATLIRDEAHGLICADRAACLRRKAINLGLLPRPETRDAA